ncbi:MAG: alpha/beta hydrolase [Moraxellaceae bacterium]|nr:alpha/beta hydrolase [Moraxellaceae bacterium]
MHATPSPTRPWVFLRGLIRQHRHWEDFPERFRAAFPGTLVLLPDLPGNGDLCDRDSPLAIAGMVASVRKQLASQHISGPVNVLALSLGAMTAIEWMRQFPEDIERAVLMNTSLRGMSTFSERLRPDNYRAIFANLLRGRAGIEREQLVLDISSNLYPHKAALAEKWAGYAATHPTSTANALRQLTAAARYRAPAARPHEHVLLLQSLGDRLVNPVCSTRIADTWRWPLQTHASAGHDLTLDDPDWVLARIADWLGTHSGSPTINGDEK